MGRGADCTLNRWVCTGWASFACFELAWVFSGSVVFCTYSTGRVFSFTQSNRVSIVLAICTLGPRAKGMVLRDLAVAVAYEELVNSKLFLCN